MKCTLLSLALLGAAASLHAQQSIVFNSGPGNACDGATQINTTENFTWYGYDCVDAELNADGDAITYTVDDTYTRGSDFIIGENSAFSTNGANVLPGTSAELGVLSLKVAGDAHVLSGSGRSAITFFIETNFGSQVITTPLVNDSTVCIQGQLVPGGSTLEVLNVVLEVSETADLDESFTLSFEYTWDPSAANASISGIDVPESDFNAATGEYDYDLPTGTVDVYPDGREFAVALENNKPTAQRINVRKTGGQLNIAGYTEVNIQTARQTGEPHEVDFQFEDVEICLGTGEFLIDTNTILTLNRTPLSYGEQRSCLGTRRGSNIVVAEAADQRFGDGGFGMQLWADGSTVSVERDATLTIDALLALASDSQTRYGATGYLDIAPGASVVVTAATTADAGPTDKIIVRLTDGGTFDMSRATPAVRNLFEVQQISSVESEIAAGDFTIAPSPAVDGRTFVTAAAGATQLASLRVMDASGRVVSDIPAVAQSGRYEVALPGNGLYAVRLTDVDGAVRTLRVVNQ